MLEGPHRAAPQVGPHALQNERRGERLARTDGAGPLLGRPDRLQPESRDRSSVPLSVPRNWPSRSGNAKRIASPAAWNFVSAFEIVARQPDASRATVSSPCSAGPNVSRSPRCQEADRLPKPPKRESPRRSAGRRSTIASSSSVSPAAIPRAAPTAGPRARRASRDAGIPATAVARHSAAATAIVNGSSGRTPNSSAPIASRGGVGHGDADRDADQREQPALRAAPGR